MRIFFFSSFKHSQSPLYLSVLSPRGWLSHDFWRVSRASFRFSDCIFSLLRSLPFFIRVVPAGRRRARNYLSNDRLIALEFQATAVAAWPCLLRQRGRALISTIEQEKGRAAKRQPAGSASRVQPPADEQHEAREAAAAVVAARPRCRQQQRRRRQHQQHTGRCRALSAMPAAGIPQPSSTSDASERPQPRSSTGVLHRWCVRARAGCVRRCVRASNLYTVT